MKLELLCDVVVCAFIMVKPAFARPNRAQTDQYFSLLFFVIIVKEKHANNLSQFTHVCIKIDVIDFERCFLNYFSFFLPCFFSIQVVFSRQTREVIWWAFWGRFSNLFFFIIFYGHLEDFQIIPPQNYSKFNRLWTAFGQ